MSSERIVDWLSEKLDYSGISQADLVELDGLLGDADRLLSVEEQRDVKFEALETGPGELSPYEGRMNMRVLREALKRRIAEKKAS